METREQIWDEFWTNTWTAEDGLTRLIEKEREMPMLNQIGTETPRNDNGVLFLSYFIVMAWSCGLRDNVRAKVAEIGSTIERLVRLPHRGLFNRRANGSKTPISPERHDNYVGIVNLSVLCGLKFHHEIVSYGASRAWNFNNIKPNEWDMESQRQGGEIAFYWHCIGTPPGFIEFAWLIAGIISNMWSRDPGKSMLTWLRLFTMAQVESSQWWVSFPLYVVSGIWKTCKDFQFGSLENMFSGYFVKHHPIVRMARWVPGWGF